MNAEAVTQGKKIIIYVTIVFVAVFFFTVFFAAIFRVDYAASVYPLDGKWILEKEGAKPEILRREYNLSKGESGAITVKLPEHEMYPNANAIVLITNGCAFKLQCGNRILYRYGAQEMAKDYMISREVQYIPVPEECAGQTIRILFTAARKGAVIDMTGSAYGDVEVLSRMFTQRRSNAILFADYLIAFGGSIILIWIVGSVQSRMHAEMILQGILISNLGLYVLCYNDLLDYLIPDVWIATSIEYLSLMAVVPFSQAVLLFTMERKKRKLQNALLLSDLVLLFAIAALQFARLIRINDYTLAIQIYMFVRSFYALTLLLRKTTLPSHMRGKEHAYLSHLAVRTGLVFMILMFFIDFALWKLGVSRNLFFGYDMRGSFIALGGVIFSGCVIISYFFFNVESEKENRLNEHLTRLAYTDSLTGLASRAACDRILSLAEAKKEAGTIVSVDLNGLKRINDMDGHQEGDNYISGFAALLGEFFNDAAVVGRMGGDEFLVYMAGEDIKKTEERMRLLGERTADGKYSYSYGIAHTSEVHGNRMHNTYLLADQRMYEMKKEYYSLHEKEGEND